MRFPSITSYTEAFINLNEHLRTLKNVRPIHDKTGEPLFHSSKGYVSLMVSYNGSIASLRCFTSVIGYERTINLLNSGVIKGDLFENEIFVFGNDQIGDYYTVFIEDSNKPDNTNGMDVSEFWEGLTPIEENGLWGYADDNGEVAIQPVYDSVGEFAEGRAVVRKEGMYGLIDREGQIIVDIAFDEISWDGSALAYVDRKGKWGCYDRLGRLVVGCKYDWVSEFSQGLLLVRNSDKYGYVNLVGEEVIPLVYDKATSFDENKIASVTICGKSVMINLQGEIEH